MIFTFEFAFTVKFLKCHLGCFQIEGEKSSVFGFTLKVCEILWKFLMLFELVISFKAKGRQGLLTLQMLNI